MQSNKKGFTLLELLIVIAILAVLGAIVIFMLNPAETLKKSRDAQRISDLSTLKTALGIIITSSTTPYLALGNTNCLQGGSAAKIYYSSSVADASCATAPTPGADANGTFSATDWCETNTTPTNVDETGWIPVVFSWLPGGSQISNLPLDPVNTTISTTPANANLVYRYTCQSTGTATKPSTVFEMNAVLESSAYTSDDNKLIKDGGDSTVFYEVGTN